MTTTTTPTAEELQSQLAEHEHQIEVAERDIGVAELDGASTAAATKRLKAARDGIARVEAALEELERRDQAASEAEGAAAASTARLASYQWAAEYLRRVQRVLSLQAELREAEQSVFGMRQEPGAGKVLNAKSFRRGGPEDSDLDSDVIQRVPGFPKRTRGGWTPISFGERTTVEAAREVEALAETRATEEANGEGRDWSGVPSTRQREQRAVREARRAKREADKAA